MSFNTDLFLDLFIALFALLNPLFVVPVFLGLTGEMPQRERQRTAAVAALTVLLALVLAALIGDQVLDLFGIHVPAFQIAGGLIVLTLALGMLKDGGDDGRRDAEEALEERAKRESVAVYPLAIPLLAGPGVFVTTIVFASRVDSLSDLLTVAAAILSIVVVTWLALALATPAARYMSKTAISIGTRILGILLAAVAVEMIISGIDTHFVPLLRQG